MTIQDKFTQNKGKDIAKKIAAEKWFEEGVILNRNEFIKWLFERKHANE